MDAIEPNKTHQLYLLLKQRIASGRLAPGHRLPSETELAQSHKLSRVTVRRALDGLAHDGLIRRQPGAGTFIIGQRDKRAVVGDLANTLAHLVAMGRSTRVKLIAFAYEQPPEVVSDALKLALDQRAQRSVRVRFIDGMPFSHLVTYVPEYIGATYSEADLAAKPLLILLERSGIVADHARQTISATLADPDVARLLDMQTGAPLLSLTRTVYDAAGRGVEHLEALYRPDLYRFEMELARTGSQKNRRWNAVAPSPKQAKRRKSAAQRRRRP